MRDELDKAYRDEYEEAKYKPLDQLVQAYKNIYGVLPIGHPQKEFEQEMRLWKGGCFFRIGKTGTGLTNENH